MSGEIEENRQECDKLRHCHSRSEGENGLNTCASHNSQYQGQSVESSATTTHKRKPMPMSLCQRLCYSVGHVLNDVTASMWFTYLLIYLHSIIDFDNVLAGYLMLLGQIVDGVCTPLIGYESDRTNGIFNLGRRKSWYLVGTICVACSFPFLFNPCIDGKTHSSVVLFIYYAPFVIIFQFGWAATQISHLSLIPDLTSVPSERVELNSLRYGFTVIANILVFGVAWLLLSLHHISPDTPGTPANFDTLQPSDTGRFRILVFTVMAIGAVFVGIFFFGTKEKCHQDIVMASEQMLSANDLPKLTMKWRCWLKEPQFYKVSILYMCARLYTNISQIYLPMYLIYTVHLGKASIAVIPLIVYGSSFIASLLMKRVTLVLGPKVTYFIGIVVAICACIYIHYIKSGSSYVYMAACVIGYGGSTMLVTALSFTADLISCNTETGAFVYGAMSFTDKISNGIGIVVIQHMHPSITVMCKSCSLFYKNVLTYVPGGAVLIALFALLSLGSQKVGLRRAHAKYLKDKKNSVGCGETEHLVPRDI